MPPTARAQTGNVGYGPGALDSVTTGDYNTAIGQNALTDDTIGSRNTATGYIALFHNKDGSGNTGNGSGALFSNIAGEHNTASGNGALYFSTGDDNTATGYAALGGYTIPRGGSSSGSRNVADGAFALNFNTGSDNVATGYSALRRNTTGTGNTAGGSNALVYNTTGSSNTAHGFYAMFYNQSGSFNTASGSGALQGNQTGEENVAAGNGALFQSHNSGNIGLGFFAGSQLITGSNNIYVGNVGGANEESGKVRIGTKGTHDGAFIAGISGVAVTGSQVVVNSNGKLGIAASSARFKQAIQPMNKASEALLQLEPVTFRYKEDLDPEKTPQFGLIAEEVEKVNPDLVVRDEEGKATTVRYEAVHAMLLNEFLKEHRRAEEQRRQFEAKFAQQQQQIDALTAGLQKVNRRAEVNKPGPRVANRR